MAHSVEGYKADLKESETFWREFFHNADKNGDGSVDIGELKRTLNTARRAKNLQEFSDSEIAVSKNKKINYVARLFKHIVVHL